MTSRTSIGLIVALGLLFMGCAKDAPRGIRFKSALCQIGYQAKLNCPSSYGSRSFLTAYPNVSDYELALNGCTACGQTDCGQCCQHTAENFRLSPIDESYYDSIHPYESEGAIHFGDHVVADNWATGEIEQRFEFEYRSGPSHYSIEFPTALMTVDAFSLPDHVDVSLIDGSPRAEVVDGVSLIGNDILCEAARRAPIANEIASQRQVFQQCQLDHCSNTSVDELLHWAEIRERRIAALNAAELLVNLARIQCQQVALESAKQAIIKRLDTIGQFSDLTDVSPDVSILESRLYDLEDQQARLDAGQIEAQANLRQLLGLSASEDARLFLDELPTFGPWSSDKDFVMSAWENRADLKTTEQLVAISQSSLDVDIGGSLAAIHPILALRLLGTQTDRPILAWLRGEELTTDDCVPEIDGSRAIDSQRRLIETEVVTSLANMVKHEQMVATGVSRVQYWQAEIDRNNEEASVRSIDPMRRYQADLSLLEAESQLINEIADLEIAKLRLMAAMGEIDESCQLDSSN